MKKVIITGIYGQDGSFLCELLSKKGYHIFGVAKKQLSANSVRIKRELDSKKIVINLFDINLYDYHEVSTFIEQVQPDEIYHMAAYHASAEGKGNLAALREQEVFNKNVLATANILESCHYLSKTVRIVTAGSCLMFDASNTQCQTEETPFESKSLYGMAKITENTLVQYYRKKGLYACTAILYNHESHRRGSQFVTKKIVENMVRIKQGEIQSFTLGALDVEKDWGYAGDYVEAMWLMLQAASPKDYIVATGELHSIYEFVNICANILGIDEWEKHVIEDSSIINRKIQGRLKGNSRAIRQELSWHMSKNFEEIVEEMVDNEKFVDYSSENRLK